MAATGSSIDARRAGRKPDTNEIRRRIRQTEANVAGSLGDRSNRNVVSVVVARYAAARPATMPSAYGGDLAQHLPDTRPGGAERHADADFAARAG